MDESWMLLRLVSNIIGRIDGYHGRKRVDCPSGKHKEGNEWQWKVHSHTEIHP